MKKFTGDEMPIETEMEKMMTTATEMEKMRITATEMTPEAGQSTERRAPGLARFHGFIGRGRVCGISQLYSEVIN